ncbi:MAG: prepilin-type N-terminal cleavage/methylation domain-containing protein [Elusimicrobiaceae bacterium]|nr:prepilin-type N-terminal cleavage/methylation domain-containing protein [Elusimicrobiaceae bacterium]
MRTQNRKGFTLIELLVVILIIGILASIAVPQYFKTVEKARVGEATSALASVRAAADRYYSNAATYPTSFGKLDIVFKNTAGSNILSGNLATLKYFSIQMANGFARAMRKGAPGYSNYTITINYSTGLLTITGGTVANTDYDSLIDK